MTLWWPGHGLQETVHVWTSTRKTKPQVSHPLVRTVKEHSTTGKILVVYYFSREPYLKKIIGIMALNKLLCIKTRKRRIMLEEKKKYILCPEVLKIHQEMRENRLRGKCYLEHCAEKKMSQMFIHSLKSSLPLPAAKLP